MQTCKIMIKKPASLMKADDVLRRIRLWSRSAAGLLLALLLLVFSIPQMDPASAGKVQWLGSMQLGSYQDRVYARPIADVEVRDDSSEGLDRFIHSDKAALRHPDPVFIKLARVWNTSLFHETSFCTKPLNRGPPALVDA